MLRGAEEIAAILVLAKQKKIELKVSLTPCYYDIQVVAINKDSAWEDAYATLAEAAAEKKSKYAALGPRFKPLIFSAGGLRNKNSAQAYKSLQKCLTRLQLSGWMRALRLFSRKTRAIASTSIAKDAPNRRLLSRLCFSLFISSFATLFVPQIAFF